METKYKIIKKAKKLFATRGYEGVSMRDLANISGMNVSNTYHYFSSKDKLLEEIFHLTNNKLGEKRRSLPQTVSAAEMLKQRITFQFDNAEDIVFVLKYYLTFRNSFKKNDTGFLPSKTYLHIEEVLNRGIKSGEFKVDDLYEDTQVIAHAINGFVLEYYPHKFSREEKRKVVAQVHRFLMRVLTNHEK